MMKKTKPTGIQKAVELAGGIRPLARLVGLSKSYVHKMVKTGVVPAEQVGHFARITSIPAHELNPRHFGFTKSSKAA